MWIEICLHFSFLFSLLIARETFKFPCTWVTGFLNLVPLAGDFGRALLLADSSPWNLKGAVRETLAGQWPERLLPTGWQRPRYLREKMLSTEPVFGTRVDPVQKEVFLGLVPTLVVTSRWHSRKLGLPRAQVSHRKVLSGVSEWPSVHAHGVRRSIPAHSVYPQAGLGPQGWAGALPPCHPDVLLMPTVGPNTRSAPSLARQICLEMWKTSLLKMMNMGKCVFQLKEIYLKALGIFFLWWDSSPRPEWKRVSSALALSP